MPTTTVSAVKANDTAFENAVQKIVEVFQIALLNARDDAARKAAADTATKGINFYKDAHDAMEKTISAVLP
jgi:hypothetical protein